MEHAESLGTCNKTSFIGVDVPSDRKDTSGVVTLPVIRKHFLIASNIRYIQISFKVCLLYGTSDVPNYHTHKDIDTPLSTAIINVATLDGVDGFIYSVQSYILDISGNCSKLKLTAMLHG